MYDPEDPFREHLTPDVKHNIVMFDYKVNYDRRSFWSLKKVDLLGEEIGKTLSSKLLEPMLKVTGSTIRRSHVLAPLYVQPHTHATVALFTLSYQGAMHQGGLPVPG